MTITQEQLGAIAHKVFHARESTLEQEAAGLQLDDIREHVVETRREQRETLTSLPDQAFSAQPAGEGEAAWAAGQVTAHLANAFGSMSGFIRPILGMPDASFTPRDMAEQPTRDDALSIHEATDAAITTFFDAIPEDADLSQTATHPRFGEMSPRGMLLLMLLHETDHLRQLRSLETN